MERTWPEQTQVVVHLVRWVVLGALVGILSGVSSAFFLVTLGWATEARLGRPELLWLLPVAGLVVGAVYHYRGADAAGGNNLILDEIHEPRAWIPRRMALLVYLGTIATHLFGGSAGREGTALQMSGSLTDALNRILRLGPEDRRVMLIAALSGGFGAVFGVPIAGCVFGLEIQAIGRVRYDAIVPALTASLVGDQVVRGLGVHHTVFDHIGPTALDVALVGKIVLAGVACGLVSIAFRLVTHQVKTTLARFIPWPPLRVAVGGFAVIGLVGVTGTEALLGLSLPLLHEALAGGAVEPAAFALKLVFTAVTLGSGFPGGEVTPLFVIGATLGAALAPVLGVPAPLMAALCFVAVFSGAANVPLTCTIMAVELFGGDAVVLFAIVCVTAYVCSSHEGIYTAQRIDTPKVRRLRPPA